MAYRIVLIDYERDRESIVAEFANWREAAKMLYDLVRKAQLYEKNIDYKIVEVSS